MPALRLLILLGYLSCCCRALAADDLGLRAPPGFEVSLYADDALAHDIFSMTVDAQGRVVVAGPGYVKILHDADGDGRAETATLFSPLPASGAHGMVFDGPDLICTGDNSLMRLVDADADGAADGAPQIWTSLRNPEHGANGLVRGPDGCYYLVCGNDAGLSERQITVVRSPVAHPRSGGVARFGADGRPLDVVAHGFRNPYDLDFDAAGHLITVDSDGERDHHLPWYAPTRLFDVASGGEHGWLLQGWTRGWNRPPSFFDSVERLDEIGRGSPTGLVVYRHRAFPAHYQGGVFSACWSLGRVYYFPLEADGATLRAHRETFLETTGDVGFAPCDLAVGPAGELYVAIGGRHTRGSVFCIRARAAAATRDAANSGEPLDLAGVLSADQPLASWSRARWVPAARQLGVTAFQRAAEDESLPIPQRVRAIEIVVELSGGPDVEWAQRVADCRHPQLRSRIAWALARAAHLPDGQRTLAHLTADSDAGVQRAAWESLAVADEIDPSQTVQPDWAIGLASRSRRVRAAAIAVARGAGQASYQAFAAQESAAAAPPAGRIARRLAALWIKRPEAAGEADRPVFTPDDFRACSDGFAAARSNPVAALEAVRLVQIGLGDVRTGPGQAEVYCGYVGNRTLDAATRAALVERFAPAFPTADAELNRELARLLGMLAAERRGLLPAIAGQWSQASSVEDDVHYLIVASLLPGDRGATVTAASAAALLGLHAKLDALGQFASRNWPLRVGETFDELCRRDPALAEAIVASGAFGHSDHALFAARLPAELRATATRKLWAACEAREHDPTSELVELVGRLPADEARPLLVSQWEHGGLRDAIALALARRPRGEDRDKFVEALASPQALVVERAAAALVSLGIHCTSAEMAAALRALKQSCGAAKQPEPRRSLVRLLNFWTEENSDVDEDPDPAKAYVGWYKLFSDYYPQAAAELAASSATDAESWKRRLAAVDWEAGAAARGRAVFELRACHRCHEQSGHLGPELKGAAARLSREDLFTAIVDPNLEVAPTFQTTLIATNSGQVYHGLIVYESPETTLLQTGPDTTVRITNTDRESTRQSRLSLMPTGLLDTLTDRDLSDLYAYLRTLAAK